MCRMPLQELAAVGNCPLAVVIAGTKEWAMQDGSGGDVVITFISPTNFQGSLSTQEKKAEIFVLWLICTTTKQEERWVTGGIRLRKCEMWKMFNRCCLWKLLCMHSFHCSWLFARPLSWYSLFYKGLSFPNFSGFKNRLHARKEIGNYY